MPPDQGSVTRWIDALRHGDEDAARLIWARYYRQLETVCRKRLPPSHRRVSNEEDIALSAFSSLFVGAREGRLPEAMNRFHLWNLLVTIATRKAVNQVVWQNRQKRGDGQVRGESVLGIPGESPGAGINQVVGDEPTPETALVFAETLQKLLDKLQDEQLSEISMMKLKAFTNEEIAAKYGCSIRTIERKLMRIRKVWDNPA